MSVHDFLHTPRDVMEFGSERSVLWHRLGCYQDDSSCKQYEYWLYHAGWFCTVNRKFVEVTFQTFTFYEQSVPKSNQIST
jgi:hypothetical protein